MTLRNARVVGYLCALGAGTLWGTTGPLSTALYAEGAELTGIGFWRIAVATAGFVVLGLFRRDLFRVDRWSLAVAGLGGGALVALFEVSYQFAIAGAGVAGAAALLYTAPVMVVLLGHPLLGEKITPASLVLAVAVTTGAILTVGGGRASGAGLAAGVAGGLLAAVAYAGTTLLARFAVPRLGSLKFLVLEIAGGTLILAIVLPLVGQAPGVPPSASAWGYVAALALGTVVLANLLFFGGVRRINAGPTAVAATIEPAVGALLGLSLFDQRLTAAGWLGLAMVVGGVAAGYARESRSST